MPKSSSNWENGLVFIDASPPQDITDCLKNTPGKELGLVMAKGATAAAIVQISAFVPFRDVSSPNRSRCHVRATEPESRDTADTISPVRLAGWRLSQRELHEQPRKADDWSPVSRASCAPTPQRRNDFGRP